MQEQAETVVIQSIALHEEAVMLQMHLQAHEIRSELEGEYAVGNDPVLGNINGGIRLKVQVEDADEARACIQEFYQARKEEELRKKKICPTCGEEECFVLEQPTWHTLLSILTLGLFASLFPFYRYHCPECEHRWN